MAIALSRGHIKGISKIVTGFCSCLHFHILLPVVYLSLFRSEDRRDWISRTSQNIFPQCHLPDPPELPRLNSSGRHPERGPEVLHKRSDLLCSGSNVVEQVPGGATLRPLPANIQETT